MSHLCRWRARLVLAVAGAFAGGAPLHAAIATGDLGVSITIEAECAITEINPLAFGTHGLIDAVVDAETTIGVQCTDTTGYTISLDPGDGTGATVAARLLGDTITYSLYSDDTRSSVWGETVGVDTVAGTGNGSEQTYTIYGRVPVQVTPAPATYNDTVLITVTY